MINRFWTWLLFRNLSGMTFEPLRLNKKQFAEYMMLLFGIQTEMAEQFGVVLHSTVTTLEALAEAYQRIENEH